MRIVITGASGRMGRTLIRQIADAADCTLAGATEHPASEHLGTDAGTLAALQPLGIAVTDDPLPLFAAADAVVDFTLPEPTVEHAGLAAQARIVHVIGTTGMTAEQQARIDAAARHATVVQSGNMSLGVNLLANLVRTVARALDESWDIEVVEMHHRHKVDAPSGTALLIAKAAAEGRDVALDDVADRGRDGHTGPRKQGAIGMAALRGGTVVGEHTAIFAGENERIELSHIASDRTIFARGALAAARWAQGKGPGKFSMADVLGLTE